MKDSAKRLILGVGVFLLAAAAVLAGGGSQSSGTHTGLLRLYLTLMHHRHKYYIYRQFLVHFPY
jgi:hypothetical protein